MQLGNGHDKVSIAQLAYGCVFDGPGIPLHPLRPSNDIGL